MEKDSPEVDNPREPKLWWKQALLGCEESSHVGRSSDGIKLSEAESCFFREAAGGEIERSVRLRSNDVFFTCLVLMEGDEITSTGSFILLAERV